MKNISIIACLLLITVSCNEKKNDSENHMSYEHNDIINISVVNEKDPICGMPTKDHLNDTLTYDGKVYGFCNEKCKLEFQKDPEKYTKKYIY